MLRKCEKVLGCLNIFGKKTHDEDNCENKNNELLEMEGEEKNISPDQNIMDGTEILPQLQDTKKQFEDEKKMERKRKADKKFLKKQKVAQNSIIAGLYDRIKALENENKALPIDSPIDSLVRDCRDQIEKCAEHQKKIDSLKLNSTKKKNERDLAKRSMPEIPSKEVQAEATEANSDFLMEDSHPKTLVQQMKEEQREVLSTSFKLWSKMVKLRCELGETKCTCTLD